MVPASEKERLHKAFASILNWIDRRRSSATKAKDIAFLDTLEKYASSSMRRLAVARTNREIGKLRQRADKLQTTAILYVQRRLR
jgi:hypothetical protein